MKVSLRDLFWLILLAAALTAWGTEHHKTVKELGECRNHLWFVRPDRGEKPSSEDLKRQAALAKFASLSDQQLEECLGELESGNRYESRHEYEPCLTEMARRKLVDRLQHHYDQMMAQRQDENGYPRFHDNLELLTALRRAQDKPDPLAIEVILGSRPPWADKYEGPCLQAIVKNIDVEKEPVCFSDGGDDRGGRSERWRFVLTDERGYQIPISNYMPWNGGGLFSFGPLQFGETGRRFNFFELRKYLSPPPSGQYSLQALYHNDLSLADDIHCSGLIVSKSEPINVIVENPSPPVAPRPRRPWFIPIAILAAGASLTIVLTIFGRYSTTARRRLLGFSWREWFWNLLLAAVAILMWLDQRHQISQIFDTSRDEAAKWSIRLTDE